MNKHWGYFKYVARHKYFVYVAGRRMGVGLLQLLRHDLSKLSPAEWGPYVDNFYDDEVRRMRSCLKKAEELGMAETAAPHRRWLQPYKDAFDAAWLHHQHANPHHWQHWVLREDSGKVKVLEMPEKYAREMVADWMGAGRAITGEWDVCSWYEKNKETIQLHPTTRWKVDFWIQELTGAP